jgi:cyclase
MKKHRIIPRLDVKGPNVVKGIQFEGLRVMGTPGTLARRYYQQGADEIIYIDIVASLYERNNLLHVIEEATELGVSVPLTVGGGIRNLDDIKRVLRAGADKVAINTAATRNPKFITEAARRFGSQCIVGSVQAKKQPDGSWETYVDCGREPTGLDAVTWARELVRLGAGELLITSVDRDGAKSGLDHALIRTVSSKVTVPVIACGGAGNEQDIIDCFVKTDCDAVSMASLLHYKRSSIDQIKQCLASASIAVRLPEEEIAMSAGTSVPVTVSVIDYGMCNLRSVSRAFESLGHTVNIISTPEEVLAATALVLPGVGAFADGMCGLQEKNLITAIKEFTLSGRPLLGICLGMQLLMTESEEFGLHAGLDLIQGSVLAFDDPSVANKKKYRVPHVGWNELHKGTSTRCGNEATHDWSNTILRNTTEGADVYFVHSFKVVPEDPVHAIAVTRYGGQEFCSAIRKDNIYGTQFHPERCGPTGLTMLRNFAQSASADAENKVAVTAHSL